jgi:very-short-patch-repair endonuclease
MTGMKHLGDALEEALTPNDGTLATAPTEAYAYLADAIRRFSINDGEFASPEEFGAAVERGRKSVEACWKVAESPIERLLAPWLVFQHYGLLLKGPAIARLDDAQTAIIERQVFICPQYKVPGARLDFALLAATKGGLLKVAVECDGKEFHDADRDYARDLRLSAKFGIPTIRASGSKIHENPAAVATRVGTLLANLAGD